MKLMKTGHREKNIRKLTKKIANLIGKGSERVAGDQTAWNLLVCT